MKNKKSDWARIIFYGVRLLCIYPHAFYDCLSKNSAQPMQNYM